jgi:predicted TIM-barrel fold metal-dependent hydrolase
VVDAQVHAWDGSPHNQRCPAGEDYAAALLRRRAELTPSAVDPAEVEQVTEHDLSRDVFDAGPVSVAVLQPVVLDDLFVLGFCPLAWHAEIAEQLPGRCLLSQELDPDRGPTGAHGIAARVRRWDLRGFTLCASRRPGAGMDLSQRWLRGALTRAARAGAAVVHLGVGPSAGLAPRCWDLAPRSSGGPRLPSWAEPVRSGSALPVRTRVVQWVPSPGFDAAQFRELALALPQIRFVLGARCLPGTQLCRLARVPNVHVLLTDLLADLLPRAAGLDFARAFGELLLAFGPDRLLFGSGYPLVLPGRLVEALMSYQFPAELRDRYPRFDAEARRAVLGGNAARLYRIPPPPGRPAGGPTAHHLDGAS